MSKPWQQNRFRKLCFLLLLMILGATACTDNQPPLSTPTPSQIPITPYHTNTPQTSPAIEENSQSQHPDPANLPPTATPYLYTIQSGDTLSVVAYRHNISLQDLLAANPGVNPNFLIVGEELFIPTGDGEFSSIPSPTPIMVNVGEPICYPNSDASSWCFIPINNPGAQNLENISAMVSIFSSNGSLLDQKIAIPPLNLVTPDHTTILTALFPLKVGRNVIVRAELITSIPVPDDDSRYIDHEIHIQSSDLYGSYARIKGRVTIPVGDNARPAREILVAAIAYDENEIPVGMRKLTIKGELSPGISEEFEISVYSVGVEIKEVSVLSEARP